MTEAVLERWRRDLVEEGNDVTVGPFWTSGIDPMTVDISDLRQSIPLKEAFDELLRQAEARAEAENRRVEPVAAHHP